MENITYKINEIFYSIQGEGRFTGTPAIFIRFAGCNLKCAYCDTDFTQKIKLTYKELLQEIKKYSCKTIILTGGEPTIQNIAPLICELDLRGYDVHVETNGHDLSKLDDARWITFSPKSTKKNYSRIVWEELKVVYTGQNMEQYEKYLTYDHNYIQPCDTGKKTNVKECIEFVKNNSKKWRLSLQCQKLINIR